MKRIHIYTDCPNFAGCENVIPVLLKDKKLNKLFNISLAYRHSLVYEEGLKKKIQANEHHIYPIEIVGNIGNRSLFGKLISAFSSLFEVLLMVSDIFVLLPHFKKLQPDVLIINNGGYPGARSCRSAVLAARMAKVKTIYFCVNNIAVPYNKAQRFLQYPVDILICKTVTKFVTASNYARQRLIQNLRLNEEDVIEVINSFEEISVKVSRQEIRGQYLTGESQLLVGCVGKLTKNKGQEYLLAAARLLKNKYKPGQFKVLLIGEGPERARYSNYVKNHKIADCVEIISYQWNIFDYLNAMDIYVQPSIESDDLPYSIREAMCMGLPIVASDFGGIPELVQDGKNGKLVPPGNAVSLAEAISSLIESVRERKQCGAESRAIYQANLSSIVASEGYQNLMNGEW